MAMQGISIPPEIAKALQDCHEQGETMVMVAFDEQLAGAIELQATIRPESKQIIHELRQRNMSIVIISGFKCQPLLASTPFGKSWRKRWAWMTILPTPYAPRACLARRLRLLMLAWRPDSTLAWRLNKAELVEKLQN